jgi:hypothetical protein
VEGEVWPGPLQVGLDVIVLLVQAPKDLENKGMVLHVLIEVVEVVSHPLHHAAAVVDAQIALYKESKLCVEVEGAHLAVAEELLLEGNPKLLSSAIAAAVAGRVVSWRSTVMVQSSHDRTTLSIQRQWGSSRVGASEERWSSRA